MVVDTSIILAIYFEEKHGAWATEQLHRHAGQLRMSTVNLTEALILIRDRQPTMADELQQRLLASGIRFVPPDEKQAQIAARARLLYPLNLGDCFAYALASNEQCGVLTLDEDFRTIDVPVVLP
jgi:ribonuclease VapC